MKIIRQINNNAALALDGNGKELVVLGRGVGFPKMPYELTDLSRIIASMGTGYPEDFFTGLPLCEAAKLRDAVDADFFE